MPPAKPEKPPKPGDVPEHRAAPAGSGAVRSVADIVAADAEDESLRKYKESLLGAAAKGDLGDVRCDIHLYDYLLMLYIERY